MDVVGHRTGVKTGAAFRAQRGELRAGLNQESFGGFGARWGKLCHGEGKLRSPAFSVKVSAGESIRLPTGCPAQPSSTLGFCVSEDRSISDLVSG
jgi:hypothetical protein